MKVLSLFDGISCGRLALKRAGLPVSAYYTSEIDKYAAAVARYHYPDNIELGDITKWKEWNIPTPDLIIGGSPCQGFSNAGKQLNFDDPRSKLFFTFVDILHEYQPKYFLLENVRMKKEWQDIISEYMGVEPIMIDSALVSAQSRCRLYWTNIPNLSLPEDRGIMLRDIVLDDGYPLALHNVYGGFRESTPRVFEDKSPTRSTNGGGGHIPSFVKNDWVHSDVAISMMNKRGEDGRTRWDYAQHSDVRNPKSAAVIANFFKGVPCNVLKDWDCIRKFHPIECERLQTLPDGWTEHGVSKRFQLCYTYGNHSYAKYRSNEWLPSARSKAVISPSQVGKLNSAISTILDSYVPVAQSCLGNVSIKAKSVLLKDANETNKHLQVTASSIIKRGNVRKTVNMPHVKFVVSRSVSMDGEDYVFDMQLLRRDGETLVELMKINLGSTNHTEILIDDIIRQKMEDGFIEWLQKKISEENCEKEKLYITLILINLIIVASIFTCVKTTRHTYVCIDSWSLLRGNSLEMELLGLETEHIIDVSNSSRYKMIGNAWTVDVISHIFRGLHE